MSKPLTGHFKKGDVAPKKTLKEFRFSDCGAYNVGDLIKLTCSQTATRLT